MMKRARRCAGLTVLALAATTAVAPAQTSARVEDAAANTASAPRWSVRASAATYVLPDEDNYVQPVVAADRGALHLEGRYNYEDRRSFSGFVGWNFAAGDTVKLELTPMFGAVVGRTDGVIPALEATLTIGRFEAYSEGEYVIDVHHSDNHFFYNWSELSLWATDWLRAGVATQRTRTIGLPRDIQRGVLAGVSIGKVEAVVYLFNPGSSDSYVVASIGFSF